MMKLGRASLAVGLGLIGATAFSSGLLGAGAAEPRSGDIRELFDPTLVAASACGSARWARNELFKPGVQLAALAADVVRAKLAAHDGDFDAASSLLEEAVAIQATIPYMEPPYGHYPVEQTLGAIRLQAGDAEAAARHFQAALTTAPSNAWSLFGLHEAQVAMADAAGAEVTAERLDAAWVGPDALLTLDRL